MSVPRRPSAMGRLVPLDDRQAQGTRRPWLVVGLLVLAAICGVVGYQLGGPERAPEPVSAPPQSEEQTRLLEEIRASLEAGERREDRLEALRGTLGSNRRAADRLRSMLEACADALRIVVLRESSIFSDPSLLRAFADSANRCYGERRVSYTGT